MISKKDYFIGIDLGASHLKFGIVDHKFRVIFKGSIPLSRKRSKKSIIKLIENSIRLLLAFARQKNIRIKSIGIGIPGIIDSDKGKIRGIPPNLPEISNLNLRRVLSKNFKYPIFMDNDANLMALAESRIGAAKGYKYALCLTIGTGIGGGIILDNNLFRGANFSGAEFGHMIICHHGIKCNCQSYGCLEMYASASAMIRRAEMLLRQGRKSIIPKLISGKLNCITTEAIFQAEKMKDKVAREVVSDTARFLGIGITSAINLLNPQIVVVGGGVAQAGKRFIQLIEKETKKRGFPAITKNLIITQAKLGNDAGFIGAAILAAEEL
ncbi:MAG: ROK family protein [candidate division Zixibacteria bacterium]|nr:ROK family protein [candidate division Zixibacteria bacterium]